MGRVHKQVKYIVLSVLRCLNLAVRSGQSPDFRVKRFSEKLITTVIKVDVYSSTFRKHVIYVAEITVCYMIFSH